MAEEVCGFPGNADTYGLGVRLGVYLSWASITIASTFFPSARKDLLDALVIFSIAFFAAIILESLDGPGETFTVELVIMGFIFFGGIVTTSISLAQDVTLGVVVVGKEQGENHEGGKADVGGDDGGRDGEQGGGGEQTADAATSTPTYQANPSLWRGTVLVLCVVGMAAHTFWLYWLAPAFLETPCGTWVFPWATLRQNSLRHGPVLIFALLSFITFPICLTALLGLMLLGPDLLAIAKALLLRQRPKVLAERDLQGYNRWIYNLAHRLRALSRGVKKRWPRKVLRPLVVIASGLAFVFSVCGIELMIQKNRIQGVNTLHAPGQLIPLVIGVAALARLVYVALIHDFALPPLIWGFSFGIESLRVS